LPIECERLQDFKDDWTKFDKNNVVVSDNQRYACIGNAVNTKVIKVIFEKIKSVLVSKKIESKIQIPKIVSFGGGRASGMMLLQLLEKGELQQWRGDCVVFNNTSAKHNATYAFISRIKKITENKYNIPFFIIEPCVCKDKIEYKLVNDLLYNVNHNPNGYKELIHQSIGLPILITYNFLSDWFASKPYIKYKYKQFFKDYTNANTDYNNKYLLEKTVNNKISLFGKNSIKYHNYVGVLFDEKHRIIKNKHSIKTPLVKARIDQKKLRTFWMNAKRSKYDLDLPFTSQI
jgi:hypothetical protein